MGETQKTKNGKKVWIVLGIVAVVLIVICAVFFLNKGDKDTYHNIKVLDAIGNVLVQRDDEEGMEAYSDMNLQSGDDVTVGDESELDLRLDDDKFVYASENTHMVVESTGDKDTSNVKISVDDGGVLHKVDKKLENGSTYEIETPNSTMAIRGTIVSANVKTDKNGKSHAEFAFYEGKGEMQLHDEEGNPVGDPIAVPQGYSCKVVLDGDEPQLDGDMTPISYEDAPEWIVEKLSTFMDEGRTLYSGDEPVTDEQMEELLGDADQEDDDDQDQPLTASTSSVNNATDNQQTTNTPADNSNKKPSTDNKDNSSNKKPSTNNQDKPTTTEPEEPATPDQDEPSGNDNQGQTGGGDQGGDQGQTGGSDQGQTDGSDQGQTGGSDQGQTDGSDQGQTGGGGNDNSGTTEGGGLDFSGN